MRLPSSALGFASLALLCAPHLAPLAAQWPERGRSADPNAGYRAADQLSKLIKEGKYQQALDAFRSAIDQATAREYQAETLFPLGAALSVEVGSLQKADLLVQQARPPWLPEWKYPELLLALGDYKGAAEAAAKAYRRRSNAGTIGVAYRMSVEAEARLRLGEVAAAEQLASKALQILAKHRKPAPFYYAPRILYTACLVESYGASPGNVKGECKRGLALAEGTVGIRRDLSLGYLALAEARLKAKDLPGSREAASHSLSLTQEMFGANHQDAVRALQLLAQADLWEGKSVSACTYGEQAVRAGLVVFGATAPRMTELRRDLAGCLDSPK